MRSPRSASQTSSGPAIAPCSVRWATSRSRWARPASVLGVTTAPSSTSLWPERYLVTEWTTTSAPTSSGRWRRGVAKVLSTTEGTPRSRAAASRVGRSATSSRGFVGDSSQSRSDAVEGVEHGLGVGDVDAPHDGRAVGLAGVERADDAVVRGVRSDDGAAVGEQRERRGHSGHAGGQDQGVPSLEVAERRLEGAPRGVAGPRVHHVPAGVVGRAEDQRCTHLPARRHRFAAQGDDAGRGGEPARYGGVSGVRHARQGMPSADRVAGDDQRPDPCRAPHATTMGSRDGPGWLSSSAAGPPSTPCRARRPPASSRRSTATGTTSSPWASPGTATGSSCPTTRRRCGWRRATSPRSTGRPRASSCRRARPTAPSPCTRPVRRPARSGRSTSSSRCCTARSARTARSRACSTSPT